MSAAEPATPATPDRAYLNAANTMPVIDLNRRRPKRALQTAQGRWGTMNTPDGTGDPGDEAGQALRGWAESIEKSFIEIGQSLSNDTTRAAFLRTLDVWERTLEGLHAQNVIGKEPLAELTATIRDLRQVPSLVHPRGIDRIDPHPR